jgi:hypothetical protein
LRFKSPSETRFLWETGFLIRKPCRSFWGRHMEGLVLLLSGLIELVVVAVPLLVEAAVFLVAAAIELAAALLELLGVGAAGALTARERHAVQATPPSATGLSQTAVAPAAAEVAPPFDWPAFRRRTRKVALVTGIMLALTLAVLLIANTFFFAAIIRWSVRGLPQRHGVTIDFDGAEGNLLTGRVRLRGVSIARPRHPISQFDLTIGDVSVDIAILRLLRGSLEFEHAEAHEVRGAYERVGRDAELLPRRGFASPRLFIEDVRITVHDAIDPNRVAALELAIDSLEAQPFRSQWAAFDVLFRSNARGTIDGHAFRIATREIADGRVTSWEADDVPVHLAAAFLGGPFAWLTDGRMDVRVIDRWALHEESLDIDMDWQLLLQDVAATAPADLPAPVQALSEPAVRFLNEHPGDVPLQFTLTINREEFSGRMSVPLEALAKAVGDAAARELARQHGVPRQAVEDAGRKVLEGVKDFLDQRRGGGAPKPQ